MLSTSGVPNFTLTSLEPQVNDGGLFVRYKYQGPDNDDTAVRVIEEQLRTSLADQGGIPSWANLGRSEVWAVKGSPWREVLALHLHNRSSAECTSRTFDDFPPQF